MLLVGQAYNLSQRPDLDGADARPRYPTSDTDRGIEVLGIDKEITRYLLARLDERTVGDERFAVAHSNDGRGRCLLQWRRIDILPLGVELVSELHRFFKHLLPLGFAELGEGLFVVMNQQHVFREDTSIDIG